MYRNPNHLHITCTKITPHLKRLRTRYKLLNNIFEQNQEILKKSLRGNCSVTYERPQLKYWQEPQQNISQALPIGLSKVLRLDRTRQ